MTTPFHVAYREQLLEVAERVTRKRRRRIRTAIAGAVTAIVGAGSLLALPNPAAADVKVEFVDGYIEVTFRGPSTSNDELLTAMRDNHIDASVNEVPTGPSARGRFTAVYVQDNPTAPQADVLGPPGTSFSGFRIREDFNGKLVIELGRAARPGEPYEAFTNAFDTGEALHCEGVLGQRLADVTARLAGLTITVRADRATGPVLPLDEALGGPDAAQYVTRGTATSATAVELTLAPEPEGADRGC